MINTKGNSITMASCPSTAPRRLVDSGLDWVMNSPELRNLGALIVPRAVDDVYRVREQIGDGVERLDGAFRAARKIDDDGSPANRGDGAGENRARRFLFAFGTHLLSE